MIKDIIRTREVGSIAGKLRKKKILSVENSVQNSLWEFMFITTLGK